MDTATLGIHYLSEASSNSVSVLSQSDECHQCLLLPLAKIQGNSSQTVSIQTRFPSTIQVLQSDNQICRFRYHFDEGGEYEFNISSNCSPVGHVNLPGSSAFMLCFSDVAIWLVSLSNILTSNFQPAILYAFVVLFGLGVFYTIGKFLFRKYSRIVVSWFTYEQFVRTDLGTPETINPPAVNESYSLANESSPQQRHRLRSLDTFRGLSLVIMIFVNYGGGGYWFFAHSAWDGLTVADLVFPWFVWIMGAAIAFAFRGPLRRHESKLGMIIKILRRTAVLFLFGLIINTDGCQPVDLNNLRIMGVLQRLAISYLVVATLEVTFGHMAMDPVVNWTENSRLQSFVKFSWDLIGSAPQWLCVLLVVTLHTCLTFLLPVPDCPSGYLGPGGLADQGQHYNCTGGAARYVDQLILGENHMYPRGTAKSVYKTMVPYDPEGVLGCLTSIIICYLGLHAGRIITLHEGHSHRIARWLFWALIWGVIAGWLCSFSQFGGAIPVNKNLWSLSFILALSSMALVLLTCLYLLCDVFKIWSGAPFVYPGMNSIAIYMGHELLANNFPVSIATQQVHWQLLAVDIWGTSLWTAIAALMHYYRVFIAI